MTAFYKLSGAGNDFIALVEPAEAPPLDRVRAWCRRGLSLGADAVLVLERAGDAVRLGYHNADGSPAALCLNGTRCAARLAFELGWAAGEVAIDTGAGRIIARAEPGGDISLLLAPPADAPERRRVEAAGRAFDGWRVSTGDPHFVVPWEGGLDAVPLVEWGRALRRHPDFAPAGTNVHFVCFTAPDELELRTYERGVEAETLACGSGVVAAAAVALARGEARLPLVARTASGAVLGLERAGGGDPERWLLRGEARLVARGELLAGAAEPPG